MYRYCLESGSLLSNNNWYPDAGQLDSEGRLRTKLYDQSDDFNFPIVNFAFICSNIPVVPAYGVYISQLIQELLVPNRISLIEGCC